MATSRPSRFPRVPYSEVRWLVDRRHVGDAPEEVAADIEGRMRKGTATESEIKEARRYAIEVHEENLKSYCRVMRGY